MVDADNQSHTTNSRHTRSVAPPSIRSSAWFIGATPCSILIARALASPEDAAALGMVRAEVEQLCRTFPLYPERQV